MDGTAHPRWRPSYRQAAYYRKDKGCHLITTQIIVDSSGVIINLEVGYEGSHHDQSNWNNSTIGVHSNLFLSSNETLLADKGYSGARLVVPFSTRQAENNPVLKMWNHAHSEERWIVEYAIAYLK